jgi:hypothetical protein
MKKVVGTVEERGTSFTCNCGSERAEAGIFYMDRRLARLCDVGADE